MRRRLAVIIVTVMATMSLALGASAHNQGPCNDNGEPGNSDYARHHIVDATPGHVPGTHMGFSLCNPSGR